MRLLVLFIFASLAWSGELRHLVITAKDPQGRPLAGLQIFIGPHTGVVTTNRGGIADTEYEPEHAPELTVRTDKFVEVHRSTRVDEQTTYVELELEPVLAALPEVVVETAHIADASRMFTRADFVRSGAGTVEEFLQRAGYEMRSDGGAGSPAMARIGGSNANQVMVFLDGMPLNSGGTGTADLAGVRLNRLESIAVTRGAKPELTSEGIGGVIELKSIDLDAATAIEFGAEFHDYVNRFQASRTQSLGAFRGRVDYEKVIGDGAFRYRIGLDDVMPVDAELGREYTRENNEVDANRLGLQFQSQVWRKFRLLGMADLQQEARGMPGYLVPNLTTEAQQKSGFSTGQISMQRSAKRWSITQKVSARHESRDYVDPESPFMKESQEAGRRTDVSTELQGQVGRVQYLTGGGATWESLDGTQVQHDVARRNRVESWSKCSLIPVGIERTSHIRMSGAVRYTRMSDTEFLTPRAEVSAVRAGSLPLQVALSCGKSLRIPDLYSLFWLEDQFAAGNPDLMPEQSNDYLVSGSLGIHTLGTLLKLSGGQQSVEQLIVWRAGFDGRWRPVNVPRAHIKSFELEATQPIWNDRVHLSGGAIWTEARDAGSDANARGKYLTFRAPRTFRAGVDWQWRGWKSAIRYRYVDARPATESNTKWLGLYRLVDAEFRRAFTLGAVAGEAELGVRNLLNENYRIVRHAPMPLREIYVGLKLSAKGAGA